MKVIVLYLALLLQSTNIFAQNFIEWSPEYKLQLSDFKSNATNLNINTVGLYPTCRIDFVYQMTNYEFMFAKNFNSKVTTTFTPSAAYIQAPDQQTAQHLLQFAQLSFDLSELYARKLRQQLFLKKSTFSNANFFQPVYSEIEKEWMDKQSELSVTTDHGRNEDATKAAQQQVLQDIELLADFCKTCKPIKKKKHE